MSVSPLPRTRLSPLTGARSPGGRKLPTTLSMARRRHMVSWTKRLLPVMALLLLASVAMWPEIARQADIGNMSKRRLGGELQAGKLVDMRYRGIDARNRPYTITASQAVQDGPDRINLVAPKGDLTSENGSWTLVESKDGVYIQHAGLLDLSNNVVLYRDNGIALRTQAATMDLKAGAGASDRPTHAEGPFGTLDAQGFALVDKGGIIQFQGASRLLLNSSHQ